MASRTISTVAPVDLRTTLRHHTGGSLDPAARISDDEAWVATRLGSGPATLHVSGRGSRLTAEAWGPGADEALERAPAHVGATDDPAGFSPREPVLRRLAERYAGLRITRSGALVEMLFRTVIAQKVTGKEAKSSYRRLAQALGEPAPGPAALTLPPPPEAVAALGYPAFHPFGIERKRAVALIGVAVHARRLQAAAESPLEDAYRVIRAVPGVGEWTAAKVGLTALGDPDAVPVGDFNLPNTLAWLLAGEPRADDERMLELLEPYRGHRGRVVRLLQASGVRAPRFAPRRPTRGFRRW